MEQTLVRYLQPKKPSFASIHPYIIIGMILPIFCFCDWNSLFQLRTSLLLSLNISVRLLYPSCYFPASASISTPIASPTTARLIAFVAEFCLYELWALWIGISFWDSSSSLWLLVLCGELISTLAFFLQSEFLFFIEDSTWTIHAFYMFYLSYPRPVPATLFGLFAAYLSIQHLPTRFRLLLSRGRSDAGIFTIRPIFNFAQTRKGIVKSAIVIRECPLEEKAWVVPMLIGQAVLTTVMYYQINYN
jgi:hypothetical protein